MDWRWTQIAEIEITVKYHVLTPLNRLENLKKLIPLLQPHGIQWHIVIDDDLPFDIGFNQDWIHISRYKNVAREFWARCNNSLNWLMDTSDKFSDEDYICFLNDDDAYEPGFFKKLRNILADVVIVSMLRGDHIPNGVSPERAHGTHELIAAPENMKVGHVGVEQIVVKWKIQKEHRLPIHIAGDGQMIEHICKHYSPEFAPDVRVLFNYLEPGRWSKHMSFYSDNGVDSFIAPHLPEIGHAVDVGANNGSFLSNSKHFEDKGWEVICVEANPLLEIEGRGCRKNWVCAACGPEDRPEVDFSIVGQYPYASYSSTQLKNEHAPNILSDDEWNKLKKETSVAKVPMRTLNTILAEFGFPKLDLLTVDVEGHELDVLSGIDLTVWRPKIIVVEAWNDRVKGELVAHLSKFSYVLDAQLGLDLLFGKR